MNEFSVPLNEGYVLPIITIKDLPALIGTRFVVPVFSLSHDLMKSLFNAEVICENKFIDVSGFGEKYEGSVYGMEDFFIGKLHFKHFEAFVPNKIELEYPLVLSGNLFQRTIYSIDSINHILTIKTDEDDDLERDFRIKKINGVLE